MKVIMELEFEMDETLLDIDDVEQAKKILLNGIVVRNDYDVDGFSLTTNIDGHNPTEDFFIKPDTQRVLSVFEDNSMDRMFRMSSNKNSAFPLKTNINTSVETTVKNKKTFIDKIASTDKNINPAELNLTVRNMTESEHKYGTAQSHQLNMQSGFIGSISGTFDYSGENITTDGFSHYLSTENPEFDIELNCVLSELRYNPKHRGILHNLEDMKLICTTRPNSLMREIASEQVYGFRADTTKYAYLIVCFPFTSKPSFRIHAYDRNKLNTNIKNAENGIRFIKPNYETLFMLKDGGNIKITDSDGVESVRECRYVDPYHFQIGINAYHISQFAELMAEHKKTVEPVSPDDLLQNKKPKSYER